MLVVLRIMCARSTGLPSRSAQLVNLDSRSFLDELNMPNLKMKTVYAEHSTFACVDDEFSIFAKHIQPIVCSFSGFASDIVRKWVYAEAK